MPLQIQDHHQLLQIDHPPSDRPSSTREMLGQVREATTLRRRISATRAWASTIPRLVHIAIARKDMRAQLGRSNDKVEADFATRRTTPLRRTGEFNA
ncbi:hypothetical protein FSC37_22625 [Piscinibacter aquaticus]|uniref:Uncharacterized protein n=1 Tax=Piscinibacter aquaticus TaxID=392597 RepID=A0A5C6TQ58_9BURK|nr:hypothetical protein FSC37_22625 [Piscinibacter aquaticus]